MEQLNLFDSIVEKKGATKICNKCNKNLPLTSFSSHSGANYLRPECKKCNNKLSKIRLELKAKYGNPPKDYKCPICSKTEEEVAGKGNNKNGGNVTQSFRLDDELDTSYWGTPKKKCSFYRYRFVPGIRYDCIIVIINTAIKSF